MTKLPSHCCLCGLLCSLEHGGTAGAPLADVAHCPRRRQWLANAETVPANSLRPWVKEVAAVTELFSAGHKSLIWVDAADVATLRAAVQVAQVSGATLHVGGTTGTEANHRVLTSEGWLGTSLGEVAAHADLIITLGDSVLTEFPLLSQRFIWPTLKEERGQWLHVSPQPAASLAQGSPAHYHWPRQTWYDQLSELAGSLHPCGPAISSSAELARFAAIVQQSRNCVWLWDVDEFCDAIDELTIRRLLGISRQLSQHGRCSLLALDSQVGRITADETLLWLTGCRATARYTQRRWVCPPEVHDSTLDAWAASFDKILFVRTVPSVGPLPNLACSHYLLPTVGWPNFELAGPSLSTLAVAPVLGGDMAIAPVTTIAAVGIESGGHLFRGDRATMFYCQAATDNAESAGRPTAAAILQAVHDRLIAQEPWHAD